VLTGTVRISRLVRDVDGGGLPPGLVRLVERARVTVVLLEERERRLLEVGGGRLLVLLLLSPVTVTVLVDLLDTLVERSRSFVDVRLRLLDERPRLCPLELLASRELPLAGAASRGAVSRDDPRTDGASAASVECLVRERPRESLDIDLVSSLGFVAFTVNAFVELLSIDLPREFISEDDAAEESEQTRWCPLFCRRCVLACSTAVEEVRTRGGRFLLAFFGSVFA
jgi:hypothetical protein